ncbi:MAG: hypothetical protein L6R37_005182 [Teloschistes peruensis]|nr:MAG: hypothetical protein L6R37_005182 [Teloschistes peruensis]
MDNVKADRPGRKHLPKLLDNFDHVGPHGKHICLVFQVMGRSLDVFSAQWKPSRIPSPIRQRVTAQLLRALDFLHRECGIIHTDIKATVIMLDLNDPDAKEDQREACIQSYLEQVPIPTGVEHDTFDYVQSRSIYAPIKDPNMVNIQLADLGSGTARIWCVLVGRIYISPSFASLKFYELPK